jgi:hypothetical protein
MTPSLTLLAFHYFRGLQNESHPGFDILIDRLESDSVRLDQGVYILRTLQDALLLDEATAYLQRFGKPYGLVRFDPKSSETLQYGLLDNLTEKKIGQWISDLNAEAAN